MINRKFCKKCVYPLDAVNMSNQKGICSSCFVIQSENKQFWKNQEKKFEKVFIKKIKKTKNNYDCLIPVSGGKDSYFQTHLIVKKYKLKPLLVTYDGNNWLPEGIYNRDRMKKIFDADHITWSPSVEVLKKINLLAFKKMGDMNWQNHVGINTAPIIIASKFKIPFIFWGETFYDISGMFSAKNEAEFSKRLRHEFDCRGFEWFDFVGKKNNLKEKDFIWAKYPEDSEIISNNIRGIYIGNYFKWDGYANFLLAKKEYQWRQSKKPFERTYRRYSNLDDRYENGIHDLMKFVKFGYGRCTDHASKDIKNGTITRSHAIKLVKKYDHVVSSDLNYWLKYVDITKDKFWKIADTFRDPRVWWIHKGKWYKNNLWGNSSSYGKVNLTKKQINLFNNRQKKYLNVYR